jgi:nitrogen-specific signal transduction histidine kinase/CheY-like chemotaxis protein
MAMLDSSQHISFVLDISERKRLEDARREAFELEEENRRAKEANTFKSKFLANMSHELRTPLNAVIGFSELLEQEIFGPLLPRQKEYVQNILTSSQHLLTLVNDVLDIAKVEAGRMELSREWTSVQQLVDSVHPILDSLASKKGVRLELGIPAGLPDVYIDPVRIKQVLYNLLANGIKFTPSGGTVELTAVADGHELRLIATDTGVGIRVDQLSRLFHPFEQLGNKSDPDREGTGLGLVLTKSLVDLHGGTISVQSEVGEGTAFTVTLPIAPFTADTEQPDIRLGELDLVLVVENDPASAELLENDLRSLGFSVAVASDAQSGLQLATKLRPAAITLNLQMPGIDAAWAMLSRLRENPGTASIPVIAVSLSDEPNRALYLGAMDYLAKPLTREKLKDCLEGIGIPTSSVDGLRVLALGEAGPGLDLVDSQLRLAGCQVTRVQSMQQEELNRRWDLVIVDASKARTQIPSAVPQSIPILAITYNGSFNQLQHPGGLSVISPPDAVRRERLVRAARSAIQGTLPRPDAIPSRSELLRHLRRACSVADREHKRVAVLTLHRSASSPISTANWAEALKSYLRRDDFIGISGKNTLAVVCYGISEEGAHKLYGRLHQALHLTSSANAPVPRIAWYPQQVSRADQLLGPYIRDLPQLASSSQ